MGHAQTATDGSAWPACCVKFTGSVKMTVRIAAQPRYSTFTKGGQIFLKYWIDWTYDWATIQTTATQERGKAMVTTNLKNDDKVTVTAIMAEATVHEPWGSAGESIVELKTKGGEYVAVPRAWVTKVLPPDPGVGNLAKVTEQYQAAPPGTYLRTFDGWRRMTNDARFNSTFYTWEQLVNSKAKVASKWDSPTT